jgi:hypothetical protein
MQCLVRPILKYLHGPQQRRQKEWKEGEKKGFPKYNKKFQKLDLAITCMWQQQHPIFFVSVGNV